MRLLFFAPLRLLREAHLAAHLAVVLTALVPASVHAQAIYAGIGPGSYVSVGATAAAYESDYGKRLLGGATLFADANVYRRIGIELEARTLRFHTDENLRETTYLAGPKISTFARGFRPYGKFLVGRGTFNFPFNYAQGSYFVLAPGGGLDWRVGKSRLNVRVLDVEYQLWPQFTFGPLHPYGVTTGLSYTILQPSR